MPLIPKVFQSTLENNELDASAAVTVGNYQSDYMPTRSLQTLQQYKQVEHKVTLYFWVSGYRTSSQHVLFLTNLSQLHCL